MVARTRLNVTLYVHCQSCSKLMSSLIWSCINKRPHWRGILERMIHGTSSVESTIWTDAHVTAKSHCTAGCDGQHPWWRVLLGDGGQLLVGPTVPARQGHRASDIQLPPGSPRSVKNKNAFTEAILSFLLFLVNLLSIPKTVHFWNHHALIGCLRRSHCTRTILYQVYLYVHDLRGGGGNKNRNLNVARELEVVARCAARRREATQYSSSLPRSVNLGWLIVFVA